MNTAKRGKHSGRMYRLYHFCFSCKILQCKYQCENGQIRPSYVKYFGITLLWPTGDIKEEGRESALDEHLALKAQNEQKSVFIILKEATSFLSRCFFYFIQILLFRSASV